MLKLRPYKPSDAKFIVSWPKDEIDFMRWSAGRFGPYPLSAERFNDYFNDDSKNDGAWAFTAYDEEGPVGFFTMRYPEDNMDEIRLGFVLVDGAKRGLGYGKKMTEKAIKFAFEFLAAEVFSLGVFADNAAAIACYKSCGFHEPAERENDFFTVLGEEWEIFAMLMTKEEYFALDSSAL